MAEASKIEWCDSTFNYWRGCTKVGPGCDHCYAEQLLDTRLHDVEWGQGKPRRLSSVQNRNLPLRWNREPFVECTLCAWRGGERDFCPDCSGHTMPTRRRVFSASLADVFDREVPIEWLVDLLDLVRRCSNLDWLLLTKRVGFVVNRLRHALQYVTQHCPAQYPMPLSSWLNAWIDNAPPPNVWLGASVVDQVELDRDGPRLLHTPAAVRFISYEPALGPITRLPVAAAGGGKLDWVIAGGESGPKARPAHPEWFRAVRDRCHAARVPFLFKQWGEWLPGHHFTPELRELDSDPEKSRYKCAQWEDDELGWDIGWTFTADEYDEDALYRVGKRHAGRQLDSRTHDGFPVVAHG